MFWVISVYFNIRNTLPKICPFLQLHPVYDIRSIRVKVNPAMDKRGVQTGMGGNVYFLKPEQNMILRYSYVYNRNNDGGVG